MRRLKKLWIEFRKRKCLCCGTEIDDDQRVCDKPDCIQFWSSITDVKRKIKKGDKLRLTYEGKIVDAEVLISSSNGKSLCLTWHTNGFLGPREELGGYVDSMPVLLCDDGVYRDVRLGLEVKIEWMKEEKEAR
jgi:hypothetical protein